MDEINIALIFSILIEISQKVKYSLGPKCYILCILCKLIIERTLEGMMKKSPLGVFAAKSFF